MTAMASNADLASRFTGPSSDPVLAAHQLVAELSQIYYEKPNDFTTVCRSAISTNGAYFTTERIQPSSPPCWARWPATRSSSR